MCALYVLRAAAIPCKALQSTFYGHIMPGPADTCSLTLELIGAGVAALFSTSLESPALGNASYPEHPPQ